MKFNYKTVIATTALVVIANPLMVSASLKTSLTDSSEIAINYEASALNSVAGLARIETQVRQASRAVCGKVSRTEASSLRAFSACKTFYNDAVEKAMNAVNDLAVAQSHKSLVVSAH